MGNNYSKPIHYIKWSESEHTMLQNFVSMRYHTMSATITQKKLKEVTKNYHFAQFGMLTDSVKMKVDEHITTVGTLSGL